MRALFAWELGNNIGHVTQIIDVANNLSRQSWEVFFALKNLSVAKEFKKDIGNRLFQAPHAPPTLTANEPLTYADDLRGCGYEDPQNLAKLIQCWRDMFDLIKPDALIAQAAPTALLASQGYEFKTFCFGNSYDVPPISTPMEPLQFWTNYSPLFLLKRERLIVENINLALNSTGSLSIENFSDILKCDKTFLCAFPETDHYLSRSKTLDEKDYYGPVFQIDSGREMNWKKGAYKRIFAYIRPESQAFQMITKTLSQLPDNYDIIIAAPGICPQYANSIKSKNLRISNKIIKLHKLLYKCNLAISHASSGITSVFAMKGIPVLMFPNHIEQLMFAQTISSWHGGKISTPPYSVRKIIVEIEFLLSDNKVKASTQKISKKYNGYDIKRQARLVANEINNIVTLSSLVPSQIKT